MNDNSARLTAHIGGRIVEMNDDHSCVEAMDLSHRDSLSRVMDASSEELEGPFARSSVALPRDNDWKPRRHSRRNRGGLLHKANALFSGKAGARSRSGNPKEEEDVTLVKEDRFALQDWKRRNDVVNGAAPFRRNGTNTSIESRKSNC